MKSFSLWLFSGIFLLILAGCDQKTEETPSETSRPVPILQLEATGQADSLRFPGRVRAATRAELAFKVSGQIINLPIKEGQKVAQGDLIAQLDDNNYKNLMQAALAKYNKAKSDYQRAKELMQLSQAVSKAEVEKQQATMQVAEAEYALAKHDFDDSKLVAPFAGVITKRHVENFSNIQDKQTIVSLQDLNNLELVINVPERLVRNGNTSQDKHLGYAVFADQPDTPLPVTLKSFSASSDNQTQSYEAVLNLDTSSSNIKVFPGMSADFIPANLGNLDGQQIKVPLQAIYSTADKRTGVWVFNPTTSRASLQIVTLGEVIGTEVLVKTGLTGTEQIVTAGLSQLREGILIRPL